MKIQRMIMIMLASLVLAACTPMDDKYKDFVKNGPIVYIAKLDNETVKVIAGRGNVNIKWPPQPDPRGNKAIIYWANRTQKHEEAYDPAQETSIYIRNLEEGSYIFDIQLTDNKGNFSNTVSLSGRVYGAIYESYLTNRRIISSSLSGNDRKVIYRENTNNTLVGMEYQWIEADKTQRSAFISPSGSYYDKDAVPPGFYEECTISGCNALSFRSRTHYSPEGGEDIFYSPWEYFFDNLKKDKVQFDFSTKKIEFAEVNDANFLRFELEWTDMTTGQPGKFVLPNGSLDAVISSYNAKEFKYYTVFKVEGQEYNSFSTSYATVIPIFAPNQKGAIWSTAVLTGADLDLITEIYINGIKCTINAQSGTSIEITTPPRTASFTPVAGTFPLTLKYSGGDGILDAGSITLYEVALLDRTKWYAAPETDLSDNPIARVNSVSAVSHSGTKPKPSDNNFNPETTPWKTIITNKKKSPYLSHFLPSAATPADNASNRPNPVIPEAPTTASGDHTNNPSAHFDNNSMTYLSMVKGIALDATWDANYFSNADFFHANGGVTISAIGEKPWFIIRLDATTPQKFNYFRMRYRENGSNGSGLKPQGVTFFGSNDDACITDNTKWTRINDNIIVPPGSLDNSTQPAAANLDLDGKTYTFGANLETGNARLGKMCEYKYIKMQYDRWAIGSNTMQIAEFWLGLLE